MLRTLTPHRRRNWRRLAVAVACLGLTGYFAHHALNGRHGLEARQRLLVRQPELTRQLGQLQSARERLERDVALLVLEPPSPDLVEEIAREVLGFVLPTDLVWIGR